MRITYLESVDFPPFENLKLDFRATASKGRLAEVHVLTGINGTGKTRILSLLAAFLGNPEALRSRFGTDRNAVEVNFMAAECCGEPVNNLTFLCDRQFTLFMNGNDGYPPGRYFPWVDSIPALAYGGTAYVADAKISVMASVPLPRKQQLLSFQKHSDQNQALFQQLANIKLQGALDHLNGGGAESKWNSVMASIEQSVQEVTGCHFSFNVQAQPESRLSVNWRRPNAPLSVNLLPDGLRSLIGWMVDAATMICLARPESEKPLSEPAIILLDEPETHLHPAWQRMVLPVAQRLFPNAQIFVATHSPFIVSSLNEGWVHRLVLKDDGTVYAREPKAAVPGDSFIDATEDDLGLGPKQWYDPETEQLLAQFREAREAALKGNGAALAETRKLGETIASRGEQLANLVGAELAQLERVLTQRKSA